jgi:hypothetical protein
MTTYEFILALFTVCAAGLALTVRYECGHDDDFDSLEADYNRLAKRCNAAETESRFLSSDLATALAEVSTLRARIPGLARERAEAAGHPCVRDEIVARFAAEVERELG